jgi:hypothetical protein
MIQRLVILARWFTIAGLAGEVAYWGGAVIWGRAFTFHFVLLNILSILVGVLGLLGLLFFTRTQMQEAFTRLLAGRPRIVNIATSVFLVALAVLPFVHAYTPGIIQYVVVSIGIAAGAITLFRWMQESEPHVSTTDKAFATQMMRAWAWISQPRVYRVVILLVLLLGTAVRLIHLGALGYSTDEGSTAFYADVIHRYGVPCAEGMCYLRGLPYLYIVSGVTAIFGITEFWVRIPGVIATMLASYVIYKLVYLLWRKRSIAFLVLLLLVVSDWSFMLGRYARMYNVFVLFSAVALYAYVKTFFEHKKWYSIVVVISSILAMLTHQFGLLLGFFSIEPLLRGRYTEYTRPLFLVTAFSVVVAGALLLSQMPSNIYADTNYISLYDQYPSLIAGSQYGYLRNMMHLEWTYLAQLMQYFPAAMTAVSALTLAAFFSIRNNRKQIITFFIASSVVALAIYKIDYAVKYLWWLLVFIQVPLGYVLYMIYRRFARVGVLLCMLFAIVNIPGIVHILERHYGQDETQFPVLMSSHIEAYHPDDKTTVEYVADHYAPGDIIVTDYWMQDVYLYHELGRKSDFFVSRWDREAFFRKFPYYELYEVPGSTETRISKDGGVLIASLQELQDVIARHQGNIWYITSADFEKRTYAYISQSAIDAYMRTYYADSVVYTGLDQVSRVYLLRSNTK